MNMNTVIINYYNNSEKELQEKNKGWVTDQILLLWCQNPYLIFF